MKLKDMTPEALEEFFAKNNTIQDRIYDKLYKDATYLIQFDLNNFHVNDYYIAPDRRSNITVKEENFADFIDDCIGFYRGTMFCSEELYNKLQRMTKHVWKYTDAYYDMSYDNWYSFTTWIENGIKDACKALTKWYVGFYDFGYSEALEEFLYLAQEDFLDTIDVNPDTLEATETITRRIA